MRAGLVVVALLTLCLPACATGRTSLDSLAATEPCPAAPVPAQDLARRLGLNYSDADSHVLLAGGSTRVRLWKDSNEVSVAGETVRLADRTQRRGGTLLVPAATAAYVEGRVGASRRSLAATPVRRPTRRAPATLARRPARRKAASPAARPICAPQPVIAERPKTPRAAAGWEPRGVCPRSWRWIVVHHSDDARGNLEKYDRIHRLNNGWDECGYHFVIGNGSLSGDGEVEIGSRWFKQKHGAHAKTPDNRFNDFGVGICLVGDFEGGGRPTRAQMDSLVRLSRFLMARYDISECDVIGHADCKPTACPGRLFPWSEFRSRLH